MSSYKVGTKINLKRRKMVDEVQVILLALLVGMILGFTV